jgi:hypothetical protein
VDWGNTTFLKEKGLVRALMGMKALIVAICLLGAILLATRYNDISVYGYFFIVPLMILIFYELARIYGNWRK